MNVNILCTRVKERYSQALLLTNNIYYLLRDFQKELKYSYKTVLLGGYRGVVRG